MRKSSPYQTLSSIFVFIIFIVCPPVEPKSILIKEFACFIKSVHHLVAQGVESSIEQALWNIEVKANPQRALNMSCQDDKLIVHGQVEGVIFVLAETIRSMLFQIFAQVLNLHAVSIVSDVQDIIKVCVG